MLPKLLQDIEEELQEKIRKGTAPFLSLFEDQIPTNIRKDIKDYFCKPQKRTIDYIVAEFHIWPALMSMYLTSELNTNLHEHFKIYPHLEKAFGISLNREKQKRKLWIGFRSACAYLDLPVSPRVSGTHYMVTEYLRQMGVPLAYAGELARRMQRLGNKIGMPDFDDPSSLRLWRDELLQSLTPPFPVTARQAIELDYQAYYVQLFLDLLEKDEAEESVDDPFQKQMLEALNEASKGFKRLGVPRVVYHDDIIHVLLPKGDTQEWRVEIDDITVFQGHGSDDRFVPIDEPLPKEVCVSNVSKTWTYQLWPDEKDNRMLLFGDKDMRLQKPIDFSNPEKGAKHKSVNLPPGDYVLLTRFEPNICNAPSTQIEESPAIYSTSLQLLPGECIDIRRGPAILRLDVDVMPMILLLGQKYQDQEGQELLASQGMSLRVILPQVQSSQYLRLKISSRCLGDSYEIPLTGSCQHDINMISVLAKWKPGVSMITVDCLPSTGKRILARAAALVWNGLERMEAGSFVCSRKPDNLNEQRSENYRLLSEETSCRLLINQVDIRIWRLAFQDGNRLQAFTFARPGLHMRLRSYGKGTATERTLFQGEHVSVASGKHEVLFVYGLEEGRLRLGDSSWILRADQQFWKAPLAVLQDAVNHNSSTLVHESKASSAIKELLHFVTPQFCYGFKTLNNLDYVLMSFQTMTPPELIVFFAENLQNGTKASLYVEVFPADGFEDVFEGGGACEVTVVDTQCHLKLYPEMWPEGLWRIEASVQCEGRFGKLSNERQDSFCCLLIIVDGAFATPKEYIEIAQKWPLEVQAQLFKRLHYVLLRCHAHETWTEIYWLQYLWRDLLGILYESVGENDISHQSLLEVLVARPPQDSSPSWIPHLQVVAERPSVLAWRADMYESIPHETGHLASCLRRMTDLKDVEEAAQSGIFNQALSMAFMQGPNITQKSLKVYLEVWPALDLDEQRRHLLDPDWLPGVGEYLGPLHYRYAVKSFLEAHRRATFAEGNTMRRGWASLVSKKANLLNVFSYSELPTKLKDWDSITNYGLEPLVDNTEMLEFAVGCSCFLASFAFYCRNQAHGGSQAVDNVKEYIGRLQKGSDMEEKHIQVGIQYILALGEELLGFYLLFWEWLFQSGLKPMY